MDCHNEQVHGIPESVEDHMYSSEIRVLEDVLH